MQSGLDIRVFFVCCLDFSWIIYEGILAYFSFFAAGRVGTTLFISWGVWILEMMEVEDIGHDMTEIKGAKNS